MKVFVTGSEGFIGSHLVSTLIERGHEVTALVQYNSFSNIGWLADLESEQLDRIKIIHGDVRDLNHLKLAMDNCEAVIHLAALIAIPYSYLAPASYIETNVNGTFNVLQAAREIGIKRVIHTSTSEVYGTAIKVPIDENHPIQTQSPYSASKSAADMLAYSFYCSFDLPVVTLRPFNVYGPRQSARAVIPSLISQIVSGQKNVFVGYTASTREFNFVTDTVSAFELALTAPDIEGETLNIGNSYEVLISEVINELKAISGSNFDIVVDETRIRPEKSEVQRLLSESSKARKLLNWSAEYSGQDGFSKGLRQTFEWFSQPANLTKYRNHENTL